MDDTHPIRFFMDDLNDLLRQLVAEARTYPPESVDRRQKLNKIIRLVTKSGKLWKEYSDYYNDAVQQMWEYCCQNLEEYDPELASVITWLDNYLKKRLRNFRDRKYREFNRQASPLQTDEQIFDPLDRVPANPDINPILEIWHKTLEWVQADPEGELQKTCFRNRPEINCQVLFLKRFPTETPWSEIAAEFSLTAAEAKDLPKFYNRRCLPLVRNFGIAQGYIEETDIPKKRKKS